MPRSRPTYILLSLVTLVLSCFCGGLALQAQETKETAGLKIFERSNLAAWCIVPFDGAKRVPEERAAMLKKLGFTKFVYDYRAEHIPQWDAEMEALKKQQVELIGWWFPTTLNDEAKRILATIEKHGMKQCDLWVTGGGKPVNSAEEQAARVNEETNRILPIAREAARLGVRVGLYNHGDWFGEPANQEAIIAKLKEMGVSNVGMVFNMHHGHEQLPELDAVLKRIAPHLICLNLNGMDKDGHTRRRTKILRVGEGLEDTHMMRAILKSGYTGPIGILNHTDEDAEKRLQENLDGLSRLVEELKAPKPHTFQPSLPPLDKAAWPYWDHPVNRDRTFDFYGKQAQDAMKHTGQEALLQASPALDSGRYGHWGNQNEDTWRDARWGRSNLGNILATPVKTDGLTLPKAVCIRIGDNGELTAVFDPQSMSFSLIRKEGFIDINDIRRGFMGGVRLGGKTVQKETPATAPQGSMYRGYYRIGNRVVFAYAQPGGEGGAQVEYLDSAWVKDGQYARERTPVAEHSLHGAIQAKQFPAQWSQWIELKGSLGDGKPFAVDTLPVPFENPYGALMFISGHDFFSDGSAAVATMTGEVWLVKGIDEKLEKVRWRRFATGLCQAQGIKIINDEIYVLGRDQITKLKDLNGDDEADFYECVANGYKTSPGGHDYITGLEVDAEGWFYFASGTEGVCRIKPGDSKEEVLGTGFRNPNNLAVSAEGVITVGLQEGDWVPASGIAEVRKGLHYGAGGPRNGQPHEQPSLYLPRFEDNSSGGQTFIAGGAWDKLKGSSNYIHYTPGAGAAFLVTRQRVGDRFQSTAQRIVGGFESGVQAGRFHPLDKHLYVSGMNGWGSYTPKDGHFQRVRHTGGIPVLVGSEIRENGVLLRFSEKLDQETAGNKASHFAQCWNYRYSAAYGSLEFSLRYPDVPGHDRVEVTRSVLLPDGVSLFLEIPQIAPAHVVHLHVGLMPGRSADLFATVHELAAPFTDYPGYQPIAKTQFKSAAASSFVLPPPAKPNPWLKEPKGREVVVEAALGLQFTQKELRAKAGERLSLTFKNPDLVPHNFVLLKPGSMQAVGEKVNLLISDPEGLSRHYVPDTADVMVYTDMVEPKKDFTIHFAVPAEKGSYPYICTFPGHWQAMQGVMIVE